MWNFWKTRKYESEVIRRLVDDAFVQHGATQYWRQAQTSDELLFIGFPDKPAFRSSSQITLQRHICNKKWLQYVISWRLKNRLVIWFPHNTPSLSCQEVFLNPRTFSLNGTYTTHFPTAFRQSSPVRIKLLKGYAWVYSSKEYSGSR